MRTVTRLTLALSLILGLSLAARAADDAKNIENTPQAKAYRAHMAAIQKGDYDGLKKGLASDVAKQMDDQLKQMGKSSKEMMEMMKMMMATDVKFTSIKVDGKKAMLGATGKMDKEVNKGQIDMVDEGGQWKVAKESWTNAK